MVLSLPVSQIIFCWFPTKDWCYLSQKPGLLLGREISLHQTPACAKHLARCVTYFSHLILTTINYTKWKLGSQFSVKWFSPRSHVSKWDIQTCTGSLLQSFPHPFNLMKTSHPPRFNVLKSLTARNSEILLGDESDAERLFVAVFLLHGPHPIMSFTVETNQKY